MKIPVPVKLSVAFRQNRIQTNHVSFFVLFFFGNYVRMITHLASADRISASTDLEEELQIIDFDETSLSSSKHPIEFLFPHLSQEGIDVNNLTRTLSTSDLTRLLMGHAAKFSNIHQTRRRNAVSTLILQRMYG